MRQKKHSNEMRLQGFSYKKSSMFENRHTRESTLSSEFGQSEMFPSSETKKYTAFKEVSLFQLSLLGSDWLFMS